MVPCSRAGTGPLMASPARAGGGWELTREGLEVKGPGGMPRTRGSRSCSPDFQAGGLPAATGPLFKVRELLTLLAPSQPR